MSNNYRNYRKNSFPLSQWILSCAIIIVMLALVYVAALSGNDAAAGNQAVNPASGSAAESTNTLPPNLTSEPLPESSSTAATIQTDATSATSTTSATSQATASGLVYTDMGVVTAEYSNVRTGPGASYELIKKVYNGETYKIIGQKDADNGITWYQLDLGGGQTGYICGSFVSRQIKVTGGKCYLTFDDGPSKNTSQILDILDRYNVKATFFVIYSSSYSDLYGEILRRGHTLALHSYSHDYKTIYSSQTAYFNDLDKLSDYINSLTGFRPDILRFPGGSSNTVSRKHCEGIMTRLTSEVEARGYKYFDWNVDSGDADGTTVPKDTLISNVKSRLGARENAVILMHDASAKTTTVDALPAIIEYIQSCGYEILPLTQDSTPVHHKVNN